MTEKIVKPKVPRPKAVKKPKYVDPDLRTLTVKQWIEELKELKKQHPTT